MASVLVDGRVYSTDAFDRGMGRYVTHFIELLQQGGHDVTILLFRNCKLVPESNLLTDFHIRFANYNPEQYIDDNSLRSQKAHEFTSYLSALIEVEKYEAYIDATPFLGPIRFDIVGCAVVAVCYDFIPLKHPDFYLTVEPSRKMYYNGLARLTKADHLVCISDTAGDELGAYLGIPIDRRTVIKPRLEDRYRAFPGIGTPTTERYLFAILGHHKSKNPQGSIKIFCDINNLNIISFKINSPKIDQMNIIKSNVVIPAEFQITASISDEEKFSLQSQAAIVAHLSLEEGFGIPLLEALFLDRKILALDIPINRELLSSAEGDMSSCVFLVSPTTHEVDLDSLSAFIDRPTDPKVFASIRLEYEDHWQSSPGLLDGAIASASRHSQDWHNALTGVIFSSVPGTSCGVADYSVAYVRSADGNMIFFFSEGDQEFLTYLPNVRACSYLDFDRFRRSRFGRAPGLFNFAFSPALHPGIGLLQSSARAGDVLLIHERRYFDGILGMEIYFDKLDQALLAYTQHEDETARDGLARRLAFHPALNQAQPNVIAAKSPISPAWLKALPVRPVSHLPPSVIAEMDALSVRSPGSVINDLEELEGDLAYVPLGIDDRHHPALLRAASRLRTRRAIQQDDIVIGHFGLILDDIKKIWEVATAFIQFATEIKQENAGRRAFFFLVGKIIDAGFFGRIAEAFSYASLSDSLIHSNPLNEIDFETEIVACDAVACFRIQQRGQLSHIYVRSLSLGTPVLVNRESGYAYDPETTIDDARIAADLNVAFHKLANDADLTAMRRQARHAYDTTHRGDASLQAILKAGVK